MRALLLALCLTSCSEVRIERSTEEVAMNREPIAAFIAAPQTYGPGTPPKKRNGTFRFPGALAIGLFFLFRKKRKNPESPSAPPPRPGPQPGTAPENPEAICGYCLAPLAGAKLLSCPIDGTLLHAECWKENRGCTRYGCSGRPAA